MDGGSDGNGLQIRSGDDGGILLTGTFFLALLLFILHPLEGSERGGVPTFGWMGGPGFPGGTWEASKPVLDPREQSHGGLKSCPSQQEWPLVSPTVPPIRSVKSCSVLHAPSPLFGINLTGGLQVGGNFLDFGHFFLPLSSQTGLLAFIP